MPYDLAGFFFSFNLNILSDFVSFPYGAHARPKEFDEIVLLDSLNCGCLGFTQAATQIYHNFVEYFQTSGNVTQELYDSLLRCLQENYMELVSDITGIFS